MPAFPLEGSRGRQP